MTQGNLNMEQVARVSIEGYMDFGLIQIQYVNVHHWEFTTAAFYELEDMEALADIYVEDLLPPYMDIFYSDTTVINNLRVRQVIGSGMMEINRPLTLTGTRTRDGDRLPPYSSLVVSTRAPYIGKRYRGRNYLSGFAEQDQQNGLWEADTANLVQDYIDAFNGHKLGVGYEPPWLFGILSDPERVLPDGTASTDDNRPVINGVLAIDQRAIVFTQKKRKYRNLLDVT